MADYSICKCIRNDKPLKRNGKYPVYLRVRVGSRNTKIPTGLEVWDGHWDAKRMEPKDKPLAIWKIQCKLPPKTKAILPP